MSPTSSYVRYNIYLQNVAASTTKRRIPWKNISRGHTSNRRWTEKIRVFGDKNFKSNRAKKNWNHVFIWNQFFFCQFPSHSFGRFTHLFKEIPFFMCLRCLLWKTISALFSEQFKSSPIHRIQPPNIGSWTSQRPLFRVPTVETDRTKFRWNKIKMLSSLQPPRFFEDN